jgi:hypothetical protein
VTVKYNVAVLVSTYTSTSSARVAVLRSELYAAASVLVALLISYIISSNSESDSCDMWCMHADTECTVDPTIYCNTLLCTPATICTAIRMSMQ